MNESRFTLDPSNRGISDEEIIEDIRRVAVALGVDSLTYNQYREGGGKLNSSVVHRRIGPWNNALRKASLKPARKTNLTNEELFENIERVWMKLGRQPRRSEIDSELSEYSSRPYVKRFGGWRAALETFVRTMEGDEYETPIEGDKHQTKKTPRYPSLKLRFLVMKRDGFRCVQCGKSPAVDPGVELHIDHVQPWSKGGETVTENLQTLCKDCNLGKGNICE